MKIFFSIFVMLLISNLKAQTHERVYPRFFEKFELYTGANLSFNYGNKFVENYKDEVIENQRELKSGYVVGFGIYKVISNKVQLNFRAQYEHKGTKSTLHTPNIRINSEYDYEYLTVSIIPKIYLGQKRNFHLAFGSYFSRLTDVVGQENVFDRSNNVGIKNRFKGRSLRGIREDGTTHTIAFSPGLRSFERIDYGLIIGVGYSLKLGTKSFVIFECLDNFGIHNLNKASIGTLENPKEKNHSLNLLISFVHKRPVRKLN